MFPPLTPNGLFTVLNSNVFILSGCSACAIDADLKHKLSSYCILYLLMNTDECTAQLEPNSNRFCFSLLLLIKDIQYKICTMYLPISVHYRGVVAIIANTQTSQTQFILINSADLCVFQNYIFTWSLVDLYLGLTMHIPYIHIIFKTKC